MRVRLVVSVASVLVALLASPAGAAETTGRATRDGWWSQGRLILPSVPAGAVAVAAAAGQPDKMAALDLQIGVDDLATVDRAALTLQDAGGTQPANAATAGIVACVITAAWQPAQGGAFANAPKYDCTKARADGYRGADASWTFDITPLVKAWAGGAPRHGIALVPTGAAPATYQVHLKGAASGTVALAVSYAPDERGGAEAVAAPAPPSDFTPPPSMGEVSFAPMPPPPAPAAAPAMTEPTIRLATPVARQRVLRGGARAGQLGGNLSPATILLVPLVLALAIGLGVVLGPAGDPRQQRKRMGGVSRVLAQRTDEGR